MSVWKPLTPGFPASMLPSVDLGGKVEVADMGVMTFVVLTMAVFGLLGLVQRFFEGL